MYEINPNIIRRIQGRRAAQTRPINEEQLRALSRDFDVFEVKVMGPERHEELHTQLHRLQLRYSI